MANARKLPKFRIGDCVKVNMELGAFQAQQPKLIGWESQFLLDSVGYVVSIRPDYAEVHFPKYVKLKLHPDSLTKVWRAEGLFLLGDVVRILDDESTVKDLQKGIAGWGPTGHMAKFLGQIGIVCMVYPCKNVMVNLCGSICAFNPLCLTLISNDEYATRYLGDALTHENVRAIISALNPPERLFKGVKDGEGLLQSLYDWEERDSYKFLKVLAATRFVLLPTATKISWLIKEQVLPREISARGEEFVEEYRRACDEGSQQIKFFRLMIVGPEGVGKTSLLKALKRQPFEEEEHSTDFIEKTDITITDLKKNWSRNVNFKDKMIETRDDSIAHLVVQRFRSSSETPPNNEDIQSDYPEFSDNEQDLILRPQDSILQTINPESYYTDSIHRESKPSESIQFEIIPSKSVPSESLASESLASETLASESVQLKPVNSKSEPSGSVRPKFDSHSVLNLRNLPLNLLKKHWYEDRTMDPIEFFTVWDLAGQSYLFCMHSLFLTPRAVYLIPVDLSVSLDSPVELREREKGRLFRREMKHNTYLEIALYWIQTIYSVARSNVEEECQSRIIIVFTKSDKVADPKGRANLYFKKIKDSLNRKTNCMSIVDPEFQIVSAKERNLDNIEQLRQSIHKNAESAQFDFPLPIRWLDFALLILSQANPVLGEKEIKRLANDTGCIDDYLEILQLFHSIGVFFFRKNILVTSLPSLLDVILHIVSPNYCYDWEFKSRDIHKDIKNALDNAVLSSKMLTLNLLNTKLSNVKSEIVQLLEEYGIILYGHGEPKQHYIPYLFRGSLLTVYNSEPQDLILYLYFPDDQVPTSFYFAFISLCISESSSTDSVPTLGFDCVKFQWGHVLTLIVDFTQHQPYIRIILQGIDYFHSRPVIFDTIFQIENWIIHLKRELILPGKIAKIVLDCPCGSFPQTLSPCVYFETYQKRSTHDTHFYCKSEEKYYSWTIFDKLKPFEKIPLKLVQNFFDEYQCYIAEKLHSPSFLRALHNIGLIDELFHFETLNILERASLFQHKISTKGNTWPNSFHTLLSNENEDQMRILFESHILRSLHSQVHVPEDLGFTPYTFNHNPCGICLIVNFENFSKSYLKLSERGGSHFDVLNLTKTFENMNFLIQTHKDLTRSEFLKIIKEISSSIPHSHNAFFCVIMSHGNENDDIYTKDNCTVKLGEILENFTADNCPSLAHKPKVFIIQACRGRWKDDGYVVEDDTSPAKSYMPVSVPENRHKPCPPPFKESCSKVPIHADFYIAQATVKGYVSYRSISKGCVFIYNFCNVLASARYTHHLVDIMAEVRRKVTSMNIVKEFMQCPEATDRLTKQLFLS